MGRKSDLSIEQIKDICKLYKEGLSTVKIGEKYNKRASSINGYLKRNNIELRSNKINSKTYTCNEDFFEVIDTELKAYWLGFMYADGYICGKNKVGISISIKDYNHLEKYKKDLNGTFNINIYNQTSGYNMNSQYCRILISSDGLYNSLTQQGCIPNKTNILTFPTEEQVPKIYVKDFIRGYIDGDGCITSSLNKHNTPEYAVKILGTDDFLNGIKNYIHENHVAIIKRYYKRKEYQIVSCLEFAGNLQVKSFLDLIYGNANIYLDRKHTRYIELCNYYDSRAYQER